MDNQFIENDQNNGGKMSDEELKIAIRTIWGGRKYGNQTFPNVNGVNAVEIRKLLDEAEKNDIELYK